MEVLGLILLLYLVILLLMLGFSIAIYVLTGIGLSRVAELEGKKKWLAWVPVASNWLLFDVTGGVKWLAFAPLVAAIVSIELPLIGSVMTLAASIYYYVYLYKLLKEYDCSSVLFWLSLFIFPVSIGCWVQVMKEAKKRLEARFIAQIQQGSTENI